MFKSSQQDITVMCVEDLDLEQRRCEQLRNPENVILVGTGRRMTLSRLFTRLWSGYELD